MGFLLNCDTSLEIDGLGDLGGIVGNISLSVQMLLTDTCWAEGEEEGGAEEELQAWLKNPVCFNCGFIPHKLEHASDTPSFSF